MKSLREGRLLHGFVGMFGAVALSFVLASTVAAVSYREIDRAAAELLSNTLPTVNELMNARTALRRLEVQVDALVSGAPVRRSHRQEIEEARADLDRGLGAATATKWFAGAREVYDVEVAPPLRELQLALDKLLASVTGGPASSREADLQRFDAAANALDISLASLGEVNQARSYAAAHRIVGTRAHLVRSVILLDVASTALAVLATAIAVRVARKFARGARRSVALERERAQELDMFAQRVAHDLMSPLGVVALSLGRIQTAHADPETARVTERAERALERARHTVDGIYQFAGSGAHPAPGARAPLRATILQAVDEQLACEEGACPAFGVEPFDEIEVAVDPAVLGVIVANLLANASKFTRGAAEPRITVRARSSARDARVEVEDTGPGVPAGLERAIFEPYRRGPGVGQPGVGLGLATVRRLVEAYGGAVGVLPASPRGAVFWFEVPRAAAASPAVSPHRAPSRAARAGNDDGAMSA